MGIDKFLGIQNDRVKRFEKLSKGQPKDKVREMEMALLKPEPIKDYVGEESKFVPLGDRTIKIVLPDSDTYHLVDKYFKITKYIEKSIPNLNLLIDFLKWMDTGAVSYDEKKRFFTVMPEETFGLKKRRHKIG